MDDNNAIRRPGETLDKLSIRPKFANNLIDAVQKIKSVVPRTLYGAHEHLDDFEHDLKRGIKDYSLTETCMRLRGYIRGLYDSGILSIDNWDVLDALLIKAVQR